MEVDTSCLIMIAESVAEVAPEAVKTLFPNAELNLLSPGSGCGDGAWAARTGSGPMLMRGDIFAALRGGGAGC